MVKQDIKTLTKELAQTMSSKRRVIVGYSKDGPDTNPPWEKVEMLYHVGFIAGIGGDEITLMMGHFGMHTFARSDGRWMSGPVRNFENGTIQDLEELETAIKSNMDGQLYEHYQAPPDVCEAPSA